MNAFDHVFGKVFGKVQLTLKLEGGRDSDFANQHQSTLSQPFQVLQRNPRVKFIRIAFLFRKRLHAPSFSSTLSLS